MAGQFYYNPGVQDRRGEIMAAGIAQAGQAIANGISQYRVQKQAKEAEEAAVEWMTKNGAKYGINTTDKGEVKAAVKAAGGGPQAMEMIVGLERAEQDRKLKQAQLDEIAAGIAAREKRTKASAAAFAPVATQRPRVMGAGEGAGFMSPENQVMTATRQPTPDEAVAAYMNAGGDPAGAENLIQTLTYLDKLKESGKTFRPELFDLGGGVTAMSTSKGSAVPIQMKKPTAPGTSVEEVPGVGKVVRDNATGDLIDGGKIIKPTDRTKATEADVSFDTNVTQALRAISEFRETVKQHGNFESDWAGNPAAAAKLKQLPYQLAIQYAKIVDPSSVAREGEVAAAQKYMIPAGLMTSNKLTLAALDSMEETVKGYQKSRGGAHGGASAASVPTKTGSAFPEYNSPEGVAAAVAAGELKPGAVVRVNGQIFRVK